MAEAQPHGGRRGGVAGVRRLGAVGAAVTVSSVLVNLLAYLVPMVGARTLPAAELGALATALAVGAIAGVPGLGLQLAVAVHRAKHGVTSTTRVALRTAGAAGGVLVLAAPVLVKALRLPVALVLALAALTVAVVLAGRWLGELQGDQRFVRLAAGMALLAVVRYGGVIAGLLLGAGLVGSVVVGVLVGCLALPVLARLAAGQDRVPEPSGAAAGSRMTARQVGAASSATLAMLVISYADLLLARQLLPAAESGAYAVGGVLTKGALWAPQVVTVLALPRLARGDRRTRTVALALVAACGMVLVTAAAVAGGLAFRLAGGPDYADLARYAPFFAATGALYALAFVLVNAQIAAGARRPAGPLWVGVVGLTAGAVLVAPHTIAGVLGCALLTAAATVALLFWLTVRPGARRAPAPLPAPQPSTR
ncbi:polysaccharide biosynthesis protein [Solwaraspora sp. WMMD1047]|uniref:polysaccharide biosynthesis protein n=1 Tax=Solwaraspora sp. WMMD1047 TaxID=3016102 RepID=UPI0024175367|nr:polysaccharide biosynthesis protein [Solwaraspora sp. WMMD1047]MDG4834059.1 polysaccharide biosynthesis protein [Solwaraspora sp. WMMD1047]